MPGAMLTVSIFTSGGAGMAGGGACGAAGCCAVRGQRQHGHHGQCQSIPASFIVCAPPCMRLAVSTHEPPQVRLRARVEWPPRRTRRARPNGSSMSVGREVSLARIVDGLCPGARVRVDGRGIEARAAHGARTSVCRRTGARIFQCGVRADFAFQPARMREVAADARLQPGDALVADHEPQLERAHAAARAARPSRGSSSPGRRPRSAGSSGWWT